MKKKNIITIIYFLFLFILLVGMGYVLIFDLRDAIKAGENPLHISIPRIARRIFFEIIAFISALIVSLISIIWKAKEKRLKNAEERRQVRKARRNEKILQLNAKIEKLRNEDDD